MLIPRKAYGLLLLLVVGAAFMLLSRTTSQSLVTYVFGPSGPVIPLTTHIVLIQFKDGTGPFAVKELISMFFGLKKACLHPTTGRPYIISITGGRDTSTEDLQNGISHAFIMHFNSNEDRDYYVNDDPAHKAFKEAAGKVLEQAQVVDFQDGIFTAPSNSVPSQE